MPPVIRAVIDSILPFYTGNIKQRLRKEFTPAPVLLHTAASILFQAHSSSSPLPA